MAWRNPGRRAARARPSTLNHHPSTNFLVARITLALPASLGGIGGGVGVDSGTEFGDARTGSSRPISEHAAGAGGSDGAKRSPASAGRTHRIADVGRSAKTVCSQTAQ